MESTPKVGRIRKGWLLTKSSWTVLKLDKELASLPLLSLVVTVVTLLGLGVMTLLGWVLIHSRGFTQSINDTTFHPAWWTKLVALFVFYFVITLVANFFAGAVIYGATRRFRGDNPTIQSSLRGAGRKFSPLVLFSLMMTTVGLALQALENRLPLAGKISAWLLGAAWSIANVFAVPVIVLSDEKVYPLDATKQSVQIIKKIWGESVVVNLGIQVIAMLAVIGYLLVWALLGTGFTVLGSALNATGAFAATIVGLGLIGLLLLVGVFTALISIAKAALYYYATTGKAPETFNQELLRAAITPKKARHIFS